jgi:RNA polymerase sigma-70 factor (ECF subfamily)
MKTLTRRASYAFETTQLGVIMSAGTGAPDALRALCETYWEPLYFFIRARGSTREDAEELTQQLFAALLVPGVLAKFDPSRGRFRGWLRGAAAHLLANERDRRTALRNGGGWTRLDLDVEAAEGTFQQDAQRALGPEQLFDRAWARTVTRRVLERIRAEFEQEGKKAAFARLEALLSGEGSDTSEEDEAEIRGKNVVALRVERHRLKEKARARCLRYLREEIGRTVASQAAVDDEIRILFRALE